jgi:hypothetical protein
MITIKYNKNIELDPGTIRIVLCSIELKDQFLFVFFGFSHSIEWRPQNLGFSLGLDVNYCKC